MTPGKQPWRGGDIGSVHVGHAKRAVWITIRVPTLSKRPQHVRGVVKLRLPRRCLKTQGTIPERARVSVQTPMEYENADWAPRRRTFSSWVKVG